MPNDQASDPNSEEWLEFNAEGSDHLSFQFTSDQSERQRQMSDRVDIQREQELRKSMQYLLMTQHYFQLNCKTDWRDMADSRLVQFEAWWNDIMPDDSVSAILIGLVILRELVHGKQLQPVQSLNAVLTKCMALASEKNLPVDESELAESYWHELSLLHMRRYIVPGVPNDPLA